MPTSQIRSPNHGESPVVSMSKKAKRALERSNIGHNIGDSHFCIISSKLDGRSDCHLILNGKAFSRDVDFHLLVTVQGYVAGPIDCPGSDAIIEHARLFVDADQCDPGNFKQT